MRIRKQLIYLEPKAKKSKSEEAEGNSLSVTSQEELEAKLSNKKLTASTLLIWNKIFGCPVVSIRFCTLNCWINQSQIWSMLWIWCMVISYKVVITTDDLDGVPLPKVSYNVYDVY